MGLKNILPSPHKKMTKDEVPSSDKPALPPIATPTFNPGDSNRNSTSPAISIASIATLKNNNSTTNTLLGSNQQINSLLNPSKSSTSLSKFPFDMPKSTSPQKKSSSPTESNTPQKQQNNSIIITPASSYPASQTEQDFDTENSNSNESDNDSVRGTPINETPDKNMPARKRSKVSRACDECRRKKVKCDAVLDQTCTTILKICKNCEKSKDSCSFTRIPLKRGPNKGFNKKHSNSVSYPPTKKDGNRSRTNSLNSTRMEDMETDQIKYPIAFPQPLPINQMNPNIQHPQIILPPLNPLQFPIMNNVSVPNNQQGIFWKVPTEMPNLSSAVGGQRRRKGSVDSTHSLSSVSSMGSGKKRPSTLVSSSDSNYRRNSRANVENSDSEDEFMTNMSHRMSGSNFQVPFSLQNRSPRHSIALETSSNRSEQRSSLSSMISTNSSNSQYQQNNNNNVPKIQQQTQPKQLTQKTPLESIFSMLDTYYILLYPQYPLLPSIEIIKSSLQALFDSPDYVIVVDIFIITLQSFVLPNEKTGDKLFVKYGDIVTAFELATRAYSIKSAFQNSIHAKIILTSAFSLLNYGIILSQYDYSLGFGIAFAFYKDWLVFKDGYDNPCFMNLIQLVVLDSLYTLYHGVPRSSTVCFAIDSNFINVFLKESGFQQNTELEWISIGLNLVVLNNNLQHLDSLDKLGDIQVTGTDFKFMAIIKLYYELFVYCRQLNIQKVINEYNNNSTNNNGSTNEYLKKEMIGIELEVSKISKKITNLIDEQIDDLEVTKPNVLVSLILIKCMRMLINIEILLKSIIQINEILDSSNLSNPTPSRNYSTLNSTNEATMNNPETVNQRGRSDSTSSLMKLSLSTNLSDYNKRFEKMIENIQSNLLRSLKINQTNPHCFKLMNELFNTKRTEINVPRTNSNKGVEYSVVIQNWIRLVNTFLAGEITKEGINGWCYL